ncbi:MAG: NblA-related protein [Nostoc sp. NMS7]|uniref:NblA-related protein n=1 Tax=Nostoc sp. NMS7 TaxID=2815391 RepID=UPI0025FE3794|nr:NblA-related protein [Nostoc sp. NMS7]MBN3946744.1 NblA-related protein [Nostoc sp. NMS7]
MQLSREQEFNICSFNRQVEHLSESEVKLALVKIYQRMIERQNYYQQELKKVWYIDGQKPDF